MWTNCGVVFDLSQGNFSPRFNFCSKQRFNEQFTLSSVDYANLYQMFTSWVEEETQDSVSDILNYAKKN